MFADSFSRDELLEINLPVPEYKPFALYDNREAWGRIPSDMAKTWIEAAQEQLDFEWPPITAQM